MKRRILILGALLALLTAFHILVPELLAPYPLRILIDMLIAVILASSLNLLLGHTGQFSLGHAGFMAIGAYASAAITTLWAPRLIGDMVFIHEVVTDGLIFLAAIVLSALLAGLCGALIGIPILRLRGDYLAVATLGFGEIVRVSILNIDSVGGARGLPGIPHYASPAWVLMVLIVTVWAIRSLLNSAHGRALWAIREDEVAAASVGIDATRCKVKAFALSSALAGAAGAIFAHHQCFINPQSFQFQRSIEIVAMVVVGGLGNNLGVALSALLLTLLPEALRKLQDILHVDLRMVIYSLLLVVIMIARPGGLFTSLGHYRQRIGRFLGISPKEAPGGDVL